MIEWSESQLMIRDAVRRFIEAEVAPHVDELEHGDNSVVVLVTRLATHVDSSRTSSGTHSCFG